MGAGEAVGGKAVGKTTIKDSVLVRSEVEGGGETDIISSVLQRSKVGDGEVDKMHGLALKTYREALVNVYEDGILEDHEETHLDLLKKTYGINDNEHRILYEDVLKELKLDHKDIKKK
jgi:hypothetical protein